MAERTVALTATEVETERPLRAEFRAIFRAHFRYVCVTLRRLGVRDADLEDVAQEVFVLIYRKLPSYDRARPVQLWIVGICFRSASAYRRLARHRRLDFDRDDADVEHTDLLPDDQLAVEQNRRLALAALDHLDADRRELLIMHDLNDIPASQIAEMLSIPTNTVYSRLRLAREDFRKVVQNLRGARGLR